MITFYQYGAMYAKVERDSIRPDPVELGDGVLFPGEFVQRLGEKARSSFEMREGHYLRYLGMVEDRTGKVLLFGVDRHEGEDIFYAFHYVNRNTLLVGGPSGCWDVVVERLEKVKDPVIVEQPTLWEVAEG